MELKKLGRSGLEIPSIGLGTWEMGGGTFSDNSRDNDAILAIREAVKLGMFLIDTAERYGVGHCEEIVGEAVKALHRDDVFIVTKVWHNHLHYDDLIKAAENSLKRLQMDRIDLYLVHFPNPDVPLRETMKAMEKLVERNLVKYIGVSNFDINQIQEAQSCLSNTSIMVDQVDYSLLVRGREQDVIPYCEKNQITVMAFKPLGRPSRDTGLPHDEFLQQIGTKYQKTAAQVALNWLISKKPVIAIPKTTTINHLKENAGAADWKLSEEDINKISSHFASFTQEYGIIRPSLP